MMNEAVGGVYAEVSPQFQRGVLLGLSRTIKASKSDASVVELGGGDLMEYRIRKLTEKEVWRLMDFPDWAIDKAKSAGVSKTQLYRQAGNSICVGVLYYIYKNLYEAMPYLFDDLKVCSCFSGIGAFEMALDRLYEEIDSKS